MGVDSHGSPRRVWAPPLDEVTPSNLRAGGRGGAPAGPGTFGHGASSGSAFARPDADPDWYSPPGAIDWLAQGTATVGPGPAATAVLATFQLPSGRVGVARDVTFSIQNMVPTTVVTLTVLNGGAAVPGWTLIQIPGRTTPFLSFSWSPDGTLIRFPAAVVISLSVTVTDAVAYTISASARGWHYPEQLRDMWAGGY